MYDDIKSYRLSEVVRLQVVESVPMQETADLSHGHGLNSADFYLRSRDGRLFPCYICHLTPLWLVCARRGMLEGQGLLQPI